jgi:hypothetical protein
MVLTTGNPWVSTSIQLLEKKLEKGDVRVSKTRFIAIPPKFPVPASQQVKIHGVSLHIPWFSHQNSW